MRKYLLKNTTILLMIAIFVMASGFCFQGLFGASKNIALAATNNISDQVDNKDTCGQETTNNQTKEPVRPTPMPKQHSSILACCIDGSHNNIVSVSQSFENGKSIQVILTIEDKSIIADLVAVAYNAPILSPPELKSVKKTILLL